MSSNEEILKILDSVPIQDLLSPIRKQAKTGNKDVVSYIRAIFQGSLDQSDVSENRRFQTFKCALSVLGLENLPSNIAMELSSLLLLKIDLFQTSNLVKLAEIFVDRAKHSDKFESRWLEIFSKVLSCLVHRDSIVYQGKDMSGSELRKNIIALLFSSESDASCLVQFASILKDVDLSENEVNIIVEKLLEILPLIELIELPPFVYQLLLISIKGKCRHALQCIAFYFIEKDKKMSHMLYENADSEDLIDNGNHVQYRQTEGTVILMISVLCRHDESISKEFLIFLKKVLHKPQFILSPFVFSTALSLSKIHKNSNEIFDTLKKSLVAAFKLTEKQKQSCWFRNQIKWKEDVLKLVKEAVKCSKFGWDHVCQGLVKFGFIILDAFGPKTIAGGTVIKSVCPEACDLGSHIIRDTFKSHRIVRQEIFEQILNRIITKSQKPVSHYIDILSQIVQSDALFLLDVLPKLIEVLDYLHFLSHSNASSILQSLAPLLKISAPLKDTLMLVLRKALFHRDIEPRKVAICGYLVLLKKINFSGKVSLSQSQTSVSSQPLSSSMISSQVKADVYVSSSSNNSKTMCLEIMGVLKRALMQQCEVRQLLYEGLYDVVLHNQSFKDIVLELLLWQFEKYYNADESEIPLHFSLCFQNQKENTLGLKEPFAHLLTSIYLILFVGPTDIMDEDYDQSAQKMLGTFLQNLMQRMIDVDVTDFQIAKDIEAGESANEFHLKTSLLLNIYEALIEYCFMLNPDFEKDGCEELLKLYHKYKQVLDSTSKKKQPKTSKSKASSAPQLFSHVTLGFISNAMKALFLNETFKHQEGLRLLRGDSDFAAHLVIACNEKFTKMSSSGKICDGFSQVMKSSFNHFTTIGKVLLKTYCTELNSDFDLAPSNKLKFTGLLAEGLSTLFNYVSNYHKKNMSKFISNIGGEDYLSESDALQHITKNIQKSIMKILSDTEDDSNVKECIPLLSVIKVLYHAFVTQQQFKTVVYKWIRQLCSQQVFQNTAISKAFLSLCFVLGHQDEKNLEFLQEIAFDVRYHLGNIDSNERVTGTPKNEIITSDVARNLHSIFFTNLEQTFEELEWVMNFMKVNTQGGIESAETSESYCRLSVEQGICSRLSDLILIFYEIVQTSVLEIVANSILKLLTRLYRILTGLTKYYMLLHKNKISQLNSAFEKLAKLTNNKLTAQAYAFITFFQVLSEKKKKGSTCQDLKIIPSLVFEIESFEKNLIIISNKYKKDLTNKMKASLSRDFRLNVSMLATAMQEKEDDSTADTLADDDDNSRVTNSPENAPVQNSPENAPAQNSPEKEDSDHMSVQSSDDENEAPKDKIEPLNTSKNIFGEEVPVNSTPPVPQKQPNGKRKRLGFRINTKRKP